MVWFVFRTPARAISITDLMRPSAVAYQALLDPLENPNLQGLEMDWGLPAHLRIKEAESMFRRDCWYWYSS